MNKLKKPEPKKSFTFRISDSDRKLLEKHYGNLTLLVRSLLEEKLKEVRK